MKFPSIIMDLLNCPGLLRLRDVRMANNQFVSFPAFASASRYEHSLGVCYLAGICAKELELDEKNKLELMLACLYHDVGTPPFAHAMEEVLQSKFGFDHEQNLKNLIMGTTGSFDGEFAQIFQGQGLKLLSVCQSKEARKIGIDVKRIARLAVGDPQEFLSELVNSKGMDLDNIDNIFRASSAMGLISEESGSMAEMLASSFILKNGKVCLNAMYSRQIYEWQRIRDLQYTAIYESIDDFAYQTMIKKALNLLLEDEEKSNGIDINSWRLTDSQMTYDILLNNEKSSEIIRRVLLCKPYICLGILYVSGKGCNKFINSNLNKIETVVGEYFVEFMGMTDKKMNSVGVPPVIVNFYPDKRKRKISNEVYLWNERIEFVQAEKYTEGVLLGIFTPFTNSNYKDIELEGKTLRKKVSFKKRELERICDILQKGLLNKYKVSLYGGMESGKNTEKSESGQLGFF